MSKSLDVCLLIPWIIKQMIAANKSNKKLPSKREKPDFFY